jgi:hypothetical protein
MDPLMSQVAIQAADDAIGRFGLHLPHRKQRRLWKRYYDSTLAALMTFEEINGARKVRARSFTSHN